MKALQRSSSEEDAGLFKNLRTLDQETAIHIVRKGVKSESKPELEVQKVEAGTLQATNPMPLTNDEALALYTDIKLSKNLYEVFGKSLKEKNVDVLLLYKKIKNAKTKCYPLSSIIEMNEIGATQYKLENKV